MSTPRNRQADALQEIRGCRYSSSKQKWIATSRKDRFQEPFPSWVRIVTWNVDFMQRGAPQRLAAALAYLRKSVFKCGTEADAPEPCCILLQEVHEHAFDAVREDAWVRRHFVVVPDGAGGAFATYYGQVTLVARTVPVLRAYSLEFGETRMGRTALVVDVLMSAPGAGAGAGDDGGGWRRATMRIANTHLEVSARTFSGLLFVPGRR
jgi:tyrosyl-DNA phosphodiesterase 2